MAEKNQSNDIAEMLKLLRQSFDADKPKDDEKASAEPKTEKNEISLEDFMIEESSDEEAELVETEEGSEDDGEDPLYDDEPKDEENDKPLEEFIEEVAEEEIELLEDDEADEDDGEDPWYDDEPKDEETDMPLEEFIEETVEEEIELSEEDAEKDDDFDIVIASADERESEEDDEDPWFVKKEAQPIEEEGAFDAEEEPLEVSDFNDEDADSLFAFDDLARTSVSDEEEDENNEITEEVTDEDEIDVFAMPEEDIEEDEIDVFAMPEEDPFEDEDPVDIFEDDVDEPQAEESEEDIDEQENIDRELVEINVLEESEETLDETDISLLQNMGYTSFAGADSTTVSEEMSVSDNGSLGDVAYDYDGEEYVIKKQGDEIKTDYAHQKKNTLIRLAIAAGMAILLLIYEMLAFSGVALPWMFNQHQFPLSHAMISLQLLVIATAMSLNLIVKGIADAFKLKSTPYSVGSILILANVIYTVIIAIARPENYTLFNFGGAFAAVLCIAYEYVLILNEEMTFCAVSCDGADKYALVEDANESSPFGDAPALRAYRTDFNKNFFGQMRKRTLEYRYIGFLVPSVIGLGIVLFVLFWIIRGNVATAMNTGMLVINFALPLGVMGAYSMPMMFALMALKKGKGAIVGHASADRYDGARFVTFDETDIFPSIKTTYVDLKPSGNQQISNVLSKTSMLFSAIGGPLSRMVETADAGDNFDKVEIISIFDDGISAKVDEAEMLVGSARFLDINGIDANAPADYRDSDGSNEILYVAIDGKLAARYYIKYVPDPDFVKAVNMLGSKGVSVGIRTRNPGVNSQIIQRRCPEMKYKVYTIKSLAENEKDITSYQSNTDSGIVAHGKAADLVSPLVIAMSLKKYYKFDAYIRYASAVLGAVLVTVFAAMGRVGEISSLASALYQLVWLAPSALIGWIISAKNR